MSESPIIKVNIDECAGQWSEAQASWQEQFLMLCYAVQVDLQEFQEYVAHRQRDMAHAFDTLDVTTDGQHLGRIDTDTLVGAPANIFLDICCLDAAKAAHK